MLPGAIGTVDVTAVQTVTDSTGSFVLRVPENGGREIRLQAVRIGYEARTVSVSTSEAHAGVELVLDPRPIDLSGLATSDPGCLIIRDRGFSVAIIDVAGTTNTC